MNRRILIISLLIIAIFLGWFKWQSGREVEQGLPLVSVEEEKISGSVSLVLDFGEGEISTYSGILAEGSVFDVLEKVAGNEGLEIESQQYDFGVFVKSIGGKENSNERAWIYFVNGSSGDVAADKRQVEEDDVIEWKYIEPIY